MATVTVYTAERTAEIEATSIVSGEINADGHLVVTRHDGTPIDMGAVSGMQMDPGGGYSKVDAFSYIGPTDPGAVPNGSVWYDTTDVAGPNASTTQKGLVELATTAEATAGVDNVRAVTPAGVAASMVAVPGTKVQVTSGLLEADTYSAYPVGVSLQSITTGWSPNAGGGLLVSNMGTTNRSSQMFYTNATSGAPTQIWTRFYNNSGGGWSPWSLITTTVALTPASFTQTTAFTSYPLGTSRLYYTAVNSTGWDFSGKLGEVITYREGTDFAKQEWTRHIGNSTNITEKWYRTANAASGWTKWMVSVPETDTGWVNMTYLSGYTSGTPEQLQYRVKNGVVYWRGGATGTFTAGTYQDVVATGAIPVAYRPNQNVRGGAVGSGMRPSGFEVNSDGTVRLGSNAISSMPTWIAFSTSYPLN